MRPPHIESLTRKLTDAPPHFESLTRNWTDAPPSLWEFEAKLNRCTPFTLRVWRETELMHPLHFESLTRNWTDAPPLTLRVWRETELMHPPHLESLTRNWTDPPPSPWEFDGLIEGSSGVVGQDFQGHLKPKKELQRPFYCKHSRWRIQIRISLLSVP